MRIIFSRKGFDSTAGGFPNIIFPDGTLFSIPIPSSRDMMSYSELLFEYKGEPIKQVLSDLTGNRIHLKKWNTCDYFNKGQKCHYDPFPIRSPLFNGMTLGQVGSSEGHLRKQGVSEDDLFLFYGWFKSINKIDGKWHYQNNDRDVHLIWGYMTIGDSPFLDTREQQEEALIKHPYLKDHPHIRKQGNVRNRIYLSKNWANFSFDPKRCLTDLKKYKGRATWRLPSCFNQPQAFSYLKNFKPIGDEVIVSYRGYGQEFVLNIDNVDTDYNRGQITSYIERLTS